MLCVCVLGQKASLEGSRPLQLPTCFRRLYAEVVGPVLETLLSPDQTAIRCGHCGTNICRTTKFLRTGPAGSPSPRLESTLG